MAVRNFKILFLLFLVTNILIVGLNFLNINSKEEVDAQCIKVLQGYPPIENIDAWDSSGACDSRAGWDSSKKYSLCVLSKVEHQDDSGDDCSEDTGNFSRCELSRIGPLSSDGRDFWHIQASRHPACNSCIRCQALCIN